MKKDSVKSIRNVAIVSVYCPAAITIDNQRQAVGFHAVDAAVQAKQRTADAMAEFRPRGLFLLNRAMPRRWDSSSVPSAGRCSRSPRP